MSHIKTNLPEVKPVWETYEDAKGQTSIEKAYDAIHPVHNPRHYTSHPSGVECIAITEHMNFCLGNAMKYIWRADLKNDAIEDLEKAKWYIEREIALRKKLEDK